MISLQHNDEEINDQKRDKFIMLRIKASRKKIIENGES
jgi:hypothetical protein